MSHMESKFQTSFIPKKPIVTARPLDIRPRTSIFFVLSVFIFILFLASVGGVFLYKGYLNKNIEKMSKALDEAQKKLDPKRVEELVRLNTKIESSKALLSAHVTITPVFDFLEKITTQSVRFKNFSYLPTATPTGEKILIGMDGEARGFAALAYQSDVMNDSGGKLRNPMFSSVNLDESGNVSFKFVAEIDPLLVSYKEKFRDIGEFMEEDTTSGDDAEYSSEFLSDESTTTPSSQPNEDLP